MTAPAPTVAAFVAGMFPPISEEEARRWHGPTATVEYAMKVRERSRETSDRLEALAVVLRSYGVTEAASVRRWLRERSAGAAFVAEVIRALEVAPDRFARLVESVRTVDEKVAAALPGIWQSSHGPDVEPPTLSDVQRWYADHWQQCLSIKE